MKSTVEGDELRKDVLAIYFKAGQPEVAPDKVIAAAPIREGALVALNDEGNAVPILSPLITGESHMAIKVKP